MLEDSTLEPSSSDNCGMSSSVGRKTGLFQFSKSLPIQLLGSATTWSFVLLLSFTRLQGLRLSGVPCVNKSLCLVPSESFDATDAIPVRRLIRKRSFVLWLIQGTRASLVLPSSSIDVDPLGLP